MKEDPDFWRLQSLTISCRRTLLVIAKHLKVGPGIDSPNGRHYNQIDYILVRKRFQLGVNSARARSFAGADIGSADDVLMMTFHLRLEGISKPKHTRLKFDIKKLKDPKKPSKLR